MSIFNTLLTKIFGHAAPPAAGQTASQTGAGVGGVPAQQPQAGATAQLAAAAPVDVEAVLDKLAAANPESLDWKLDR